MPNEDSLNQSLKPVELTGRPTERLKKSYWDKRAGTYDQMEEDSNRTERRKKAYKYYFEKLKDLLAPGEITYLDFGCATGTHTRQFISGLKNNPIKEGFGITLAGEEVALATPTLPEFQIIEGGVEKIDPFESKFDLITSFFYVLGELSEADLELFFQNIARSLKPGGILCFDVPKGKPLAQGEAVKYHTYDTILPDGSVLPGGMIRDFSEEEIIDLAKRNNLEIIEIAGQSDSKGEYEEYMVILRKKTMS